MAKTVLVVDDDSSIIESLKYLLKEEGYEVMTSGDGKICRRGFNGQKPNLILLDYWLPRENGGDLTREPKNNDSTKDIPVIVISASYNIVDAVKEAGADDFVPKPYDPVHLLEKIEKYIS